MVLNLGGKSLLKSESRENSTKADLKKNFILTGSMTGAYTATSEIFIHLDDSSAGGETDDGRFVNPYTKIKLIRAEVLTVENNFTDTGDNYMEVDLFEGSTGGGGSGAGSWNSLAQGQAFNGNLTNGFIDNLGNPTLIKGQIPMWATLTNGMGGNSKGVTIQSEWEIILE